MSTEKHLLITGVSGFIGGALLSHLAPGHQVIGLSRRRWNDKLPSNARVVQGDFASFEDLRQLDEYSIGGLIHLAAETGNGTEEGCLSTNVLGTRRLLRYLIDKGCRKFVMASSIAAAGCLQAGFIPQQVPVDDDHPCQARDAYGFSKAMMEELTQHMHRVHEDTDFTNLRLGVVVDEAKWEPLHITTETPLGAPFAELVRVMKNDVLAAIEAAVLALQRPGVRNYNVVGPDATCDDKVADMLRAYFKERADELDLSFYAQPGQEHAALYAMSKIKAELGFTPQHTTR